MKVTVQHSNGRSFSLENVLRVKVTPVKGKLALQVELQLQGGPTYCHGVQALIIDAPQKD